MCIWGVGGELVKASNKWNLLDCKSKQNKTKQNKKNNPIPEFPVEFLVTPFLSESVDQNSHVQPKGGRGGVLIFWGCLLSHSEGNLEVVLIFLGCVIFGETQYLLVTGP